MILNIGMKRTTFCNKPHFKNSTSSSLLVNQISMTYRGKYHAEEKISLDACLKISKFLQSLTQKYLVAEISRKRFHNENGRKRKGTVDDDAFFLLPQYSVCSGDRIAEGKCGLVGFCYEKSSLQITHRVAYCDAV